MNKTSDQYSPFLDWNPDDSVTVDSVAPALVSLASMLRDGYPFNTELVIAASTLLSSFNWRRHNSLTIDHLLKAIGQHFPDPAAVFVDSITILLSSPHPSIFREALPFIRRCLNYCYPSNRLALVSSKLLPGIISTPHLRDLSVIDNQGMMNDICVIFDRCVCLSSTDTVLYFSTTLDIDPQSIRNLVLHEVLIPFEPSLVQISRNPRFVSWDYEYQNASIFLIDIFDMSAYHQPTLDFVCSSRIPIVFQSLLSKVENIFPHRVIISSLAENIRKWKEDGAETADRGRILLQTLEREGFHEGIEQTLFHNKSSENGRFVRWYSFEIMNYLGMNSSEPEIDDP
ncbi:hypothetical protein BLNAU_3233 [Blattamonas nauphoetae]|uniref:Uncharacterized protein n=1 Tax=Blattamonas nauphoetae TaxID=2049346 RepID=A0ABQ9YDF4_9EUKA|nr:hypothetical protein BLNAU_3233 [Blattamonas nauphoetae]